MHVYEVDLASCGPLRLAVESRPPRWLHAVFVGFAALLLAALAWSWLAQLDVVVAAPGRLRPRTMPIAVGLAAEPGRAAVGSRVAEVHARAGDRVRAGDVVAVLDTRALQLELAELHGSIARKDAELALLSALGERHDEHARAERERIDAEIAQASRTGARDDRARRIDLARTQAALERVREREREAERLVAEGHASREELDTLRRERQGLEADARKLGLGQTTAVEVLRRSQVVLERAHQLELLDLQVRAQAVAAALDGARAELARRLLALSEASLRAPIDGVITDSALEVGALLDAGAAAFTVAPTDGYRFEAIVDSADAGHLAPGMAARVAIDTFDAQQYGMLDGTVTYVSADSAAADSAGLRYVVHVELPTDVIGRGDRLAELRLGLGGRVQVVVGHERVLSLLLADLEHRFDVEWSP